MVLVTISLTWRGTGRADLGAIGDLISKYLPLLLKSQSKGDRVLRALKGERMAECDALNGERMVDVALMGDSLPENMGEGGIRSFPSRAVAGADEGMAGVAKVGDFDVGDLCVSQLQEQLLCSLAPVDGVELADGVEPVDGAEVGVFLPDNNLSPAVGLAIILRKSV